MRLTFRAKTFNFFFQCVDVIVEKFKEKKITVVTALREAIDAVYQTVSNWSWLIIVLPVTYCYLPG